MYPFERRERIMERLRNGRQVTVREEMDLLGVSHVTLHRDLAALERQGLIKRVRGGAILLEPLKSNTHFDLRKDVRAKEKQEIAKRAAKFVRDDTSIFLDHSTTILFFAEELRKRSFRNLIILTNSMEIPDEFVEVKGVQVISTGGIVEHEYRAFSGRWVAESLQRINLHQMFVSVGGLSVERGLMTQMPFIREALGDILRSGLQVNVLADSSKFMKIGTFQIAPLDPSFRIFTDSGISKTILAEIRKKGVTVVV
jgi:DeoR family transcriptional regulator, fructose operon transcriptional repressor